MPTSPPLLLRLPPIPPPLLWADMDAAAVAAVAVAAAAPAAVQKCAGAATSAPAKSPDAIRRGACTTYGQGAHRAPRFMEVMLHVSLNPNHST